MLATKVKFLFYLLSQINYINVILYLSSAVIESVATQQKQQQQQPAKAAERPHSPFCSKPPRLPQAVRHLYLTHSSLTIISMPAAILTVAAVDNINILEINKSYPVVYASRIVRGTLTTFLLAILRNADHIVKIYMPEIHDNDIQDNLIISINTKSEKSNLIYTG